jgi:ketosteroid isomerase-like protein
MIESPEQLHRAFQEAFNRHDLESIVALYEPGALAMHPSIDVQTLSVNLAGNLALLHGKWILHQTGADGGQVPGRVGIQKPLASSRMGVIVRGRGRAGQRAGLRARRR